jgi:hypothetical protein
MPVLKAELRSLVTTDGAVILDIAADEMTTLNATGGYVWARLKEGKTVEEIVADLAFETKENPLRVAVDVHDFIEQLANKHLVHQ